MRGDERGCSPRPSRRHRRASDRRGSSRRARGRAARRGRRSRERRSGAAAQRRPTLQQRGDDRRAGTAKTNTARTSVSDAGERAGRGPRPDAPASPRACERRSTPASTSVPGELSPSAGAARSASTTGRAAYTAAARGARRPAPHQRRTVIISSHAGRARTALPARASAGRVVRLQRSAASRRGRGRPGSRVGGRPGARARTRPPGGDRRASDVEPLGEDVDEPGLQWRRVRRVAQGIRRRDVRPTVGLLVRADERHVDEPVDARRHRQDERDATGTARRADSSADCAAPPRPERRPHIRRRRDRGRSRRRTGHWLWIPLLLAEGLVAGAALLYAWFESRTGCGSTRCSRSLVGAPARPARASTSGSTSAVTRTRAPSSAGKGTG